MLLFQGNAYGLQNHLFHGEISVGKGMAAVIAECLGKTEILVGKSRMVVEVNDSIRIGICLQAFIDINDSLAWIFDLFTPRELGAGWDGADDGHDAMGLGLVAHGNDVVDHSFGRHPIFVVCHIVGASHDDHSLWVQVYDIIIESHQHLRGGLATDASATEVVTAEKIRVEKGPVVGDGVAHKDHFWIVAAGNDAFVVGSITVEAEPVLGIAEE